MVARHSEATKLNEAKQIARSHNCFVMERIERVLSKEGGFVNQTSWILYRLGEPRNTYLGKRKTIAGIIRLVKQATTAES